MNGQTRSTKFNKYLRLGTDGVLLMLGLYTGAVQYAAAAHQANQKQDTSDGE
jgi:dihydroxyacetone kinase